MAEPDKAAQLCGSKVPFKLKFTIASPSPDDLTPTGLCFAQATPCFQALGVANADQHSYPPRSRPYCSTGRQVQKIFRSP